MAGDISDLLGISESPSRTFQGHYAKDHSLHLERIVRLAVHSVGLASTAVFIRLGVLAGLFFPIVDRCGVIELVKLSDLGKVYSLCEVLVVELDPCSLDIRCQM